MKTYSHSSIFTALAVWLFLGIGLNAQSFVFDDFSNTTSLSINGSAQSVTTSDGQVLRLVGGQTPQAGSVFFSVPVDIFSFSTAFEFRIRNSGGQQDGTGEAGGDGLVFVMQGQSPTALGGAGHEIGYAPISPSVGVEFDTYDNGSFLSDTDSNHVAILEDGTVDHASVPWNFPISVSPQFDDGQKWFVWVDYDGTNLEVRLSQDGTRPLLAKVETSIFFTSLMDPNGSGLAYVGFTAGQWNAWGDCDLIRWEFGPLNSILSLGSFSPGIAGQVNTLQIENASPSDTVHLVYGFASGTHPLSFCPGLALDILNPQLGGTIGTDQGGFGQVTANLPAGLSGRALLLQAVEVSSCRISNTVTQVIL